MPEYVLQIDWDADGAFESGAEIVTERTLARTAITTSRGRDQLRSLAPPMAGALDAELLNTSRDYSAENADSPLVGLLLPGRLVQLEGGAGTLYDAAIGYDSDTPYNGTTVLWTGLLDDLPQHPELQRKSVSIPSLGTLSRLRRPSGKGISTALYASITTDVALGHLLDAAGWPAADRVLDTGKTTLLWWWLDNADPYQAMLDLLASEGPGAAIYEDVQGRIVFESRHYRLLTARCTASQATLRDTGAEPRFSLPYQYDGGMKHIVNQCTVEVRVRSAAALGVVWTLGSTVTLAPNEARSYEARHSSSDPFTAAVCLDATDYTVAAGSLASVVLDRTSGASCTITLTAGATGATVTGLQVRAQLVSVDNTLQRTNSVDTTTSQTRYGLRLYPLSVRTEIDVDLAQDLCDAVVRAYQAPRASLSLTLNNGHADRLTQAVTREISDRITVVEAQTGVNGPFYVERIEHRISSGGALHETVLGCEKADTVTVFVLGTSALNDAKVVWW